MVLYHFSFKYTGAMRLTFALEEMYLVCRHRWYIRQRETPFYNEATIATKRDLRNQTMTLKSHYKVNLSVS